MAKKKMSLKEREAKWAEEDAELESYCRFESIPSAVVRYPEPPDPWMLALLEARGKRKNGRRR